MQRAPGVASAVYGGGACMALALRQSRTRRSPPDFFATVKAPMVHLAAVRSVSSPFFQSSRMKR
eukprot:4775320-Lingulodinium_polyedra.AAC.1